MNNNLAAHQDAEQPTREWAERQWRRWEAENRFSVFPVRRTHAVGVWPQDQRDHYAVLFPAHRIGTFLEFVAYEFFHSSVLQTVARGKSDGEWFRFESMDAYSDRLLAFLDRQSAFLSPVATVRWLRTWELPSDLQWVESLVHVRAVTRDVPSDATMWSETTEGYLVFLVIKG